MQDTGTGIGKVTPLLTGVGMYLPFSFPKENRQGPRFNLWVRDRFEGQDSNFHQEVSVSEANAIAIITPSIIAYFDCHV
ncbi:MAG: hypothetical protein B6D63_06305 [Candidatus Latescibacteria bacterium 4484_7]|nr:MAG: hypothetical protein B6D63_06305 [Candidatus Latescibacteria bacterium 4484_7]